MATKTKKKSVKPKAVAKPVKVVKAAEPETPTRGPGRAALPPGQVKQRQQIFLAPKTVTFMEKLAQKISKSRGTTVRATQLEAEVLENYVQKQKAKLSQDKPKK